MKICVFCFFAVLLQSDKVRILFADDFLITNFIYALEINSVKRYNYYEEINYFGFGDVYVAYFCYGSGGNRYW